MKEQGKNVRLEQINQSQLKTKKAEKRSYYVGAVSASRNTISYDYNQTLNVPSIVLTPAKQEQSNLALNNSLVDRSLNSDLKKAIDEYHTETKEVLKHQRSNHSIAKQKRMKTLSPSSTGHSSQEQYRMVYLKRYLTAL